jgi:hypothetical protein
VGNAQRCPHIHSLRPCFDLADGEDLRAMQLVTRKAVLKQSTPGSGRPRCHRWDTGEAVVPPAIGRLSSDLVYFYNCRKEDFPRF